MNSIALRKARGVGAEGVDLALETHDERMRHGADDGHAVVFAGHDLLVPAKPAR